MDEIARIAKEHGLTVVEDCAQAPGSKYAGRYVGTIGHMGVFSFQESKNMTTGEGGMILTDDPALAERCRLIRNHGESIPDETWDDAELAGLVGYNFRITEITAAIGIAQLAKLDENNRVRNENSHFLAGRLRDMRGLTVPDWVGEEDSIVHIMPVIFDEQEVGAPRGKVLAALRSEGIPVGSGYQRLMPETPAFARRVGLHASGCPFTCRFRGDESGVAPASFPVGERLLRREFIWFYHINRPNTLQDMVDVAAAFDKVLANAAALAASDVAPFSGYKW
jgi:perosamine synthetase